MNKHPAGPWIAARDLEPQHGIRLFCLPHAGSGAAAFHRWRRLLPGSIQVCPVLLPGRELRLAERCVEDAGALVAQLAEATESLLTRPYAIFGHSMGSLLAYEWTRQIQARGLPMPEWLIVSGRNAPGTEEPPRALRGLGEEELVNELRVRYGGMPSSFLDDPELREMFLPILRADLALVETYDPGPAVAPLPCALAACAGSEDESVTDAGLRGWARLTSGRSRVERFAGDHFYHIGAGQSALLHLVATLLAPVTR